MMARKQLCVIGFFLLNLLDLFLTVEIIGLGYGFEGNPLMAAMFDRGLPAVVMYKLIFPFLLGIVLINYRGPRIRGAAALYVLIILWSVLCLYNLAILFMGGLQC